MTDAKKNTKTSVDETDSQDMFDLALKTYFHQQHDPVSPTAEELAELRRLPKEQPPSRVEPSGQPMERLRRLLLLWVPVALTASLMMVWGVSLWGGNQTVLRPKGASWQFLYARRGTSKGHQLLTQEMKNGIVLRPKDLIQFAYQFSQPTYVAIVGINEQGKIYTLLDDGKKHSLLVAKGRSALPQEKGEVRAFELDDYLGKERFFVLTSAKKIAVAMFTEKLSQAWKQKPTLDSLPELSGPWNVASVWVQKKR